MVSVRPVRQEDEERLAVVVPSLTNLPVFTPLSDQGPVEFARRESHIDYRGRFGRGAATGPPEQIVGHAVFAAAGGEEAEVAFAVADGYQGRGLGTILLGRLAEIAAAQGIRPFVAFVLFESRAMLNVFRESGFPLDLKVDAGEFTVTFPTSFAEEALARFDRREQIAAAEAARGIRLHLRGGEETRAVEMARRLASGGVAVEGYSVQPVPLRASR